VVLSNGYRKATCWKNGIEIPLQFGANIISSEAVGITVSNNDVYVVGNTYTPEFYGIATFWKNGVQIALNDPNTSVASAAAITVSGQDVYVAGQTGFSPQSAAYWKNGLVTVFSQNNVSSMATAIQVQNNDVFVAGQAAPSTNGQFQNFLYSFVYWKNGSIVNSDWKNKPDARLNVGSMNVIDTNVYVAGTFENHPVYWYNGRLIQLSANQGTAKSIIVAKN
jgi:hypothetical protein